MKRPDAEERRTVAPRRDQSNTIAESRINAASNGRWPERRRAGVVESRGSARGAPTMDHCETEIYMSQLWPVRAERKLLQGLWL